jgi:RNA polymerase sigma-70 factor, ECF subfamily
MLSDEELIQVANTGDPTGFEELYFRYRDWVYNLAWRFTGDASDAMDVLQETFLYLLGKLPGFELQAKMTTFLYPTVKHLSFRVLQKKRRGVSGEEWLAGVEQPVTAASGGDTEELAKIISELPEKQREVLMLRFVDDLSLEQIGEALDIPPGTVKSRLHRALEMLRESPKTRKYFQE